MKKAIKKIISSMLIIVVLLLAGNLQKVDAVGVLHQAWVQEDGELSYVLFRMYATPYKSVYNQYAGYTKREKVKGTATEDGSFWNSQVGTNQISKWVYKDDNASLASFATGHGYYHTSSLIFYGRTEKDPIVFTDTIGKYTITSDGKEGYVQFKPVNKAIGSKIDTALYNSATRVKVNVGKSYPANWKQGAASGNEVIPDDYTSGSGNVKISEKNIVYLTGLDSTQIKDINPITSTDPWYRMTLVASANKPQAQAIYITDRKLENKDVTKITNRAINNNNFFEYEGYKTCLRVSNVITTQTYGAGYRCKDTSNDILMTPYSFVNQGDKLSASDYGREAKALGSALNLYDNIIVFPSTGTRTIEIRHINIGQAKNISTSAVENGTTNPASGYTNVKVDSDGKVSYKIVDEDGNITYKEEYKLNSLLIDDEKDEKNRNNDIEDLDFAEEYIGYNVANASTKKEAEDIIAEKVAAGNVDSKKDSYNPGTYSKAKDEVIIVEMYYKDKAREFESTHIYYDESGNEIDRQVEKHKKDDNDELVKINSTKTVYSKGETEEYKYLGAIAKKEKKDPAIGDYDEDKDELTLTYDNDKDPLKYGYFGYQKKKFGEFTEVHIYYDEAGNEIDRKSTSYSTDDEGSAIYIGSKKTVYKKAIPDKHKYLGAIEGKSNTTPGIDDYDKDKDKLVLRYNSDKDDKCGYFGYQKQQTGQVIEHHILYTKGEGSSEIKRQVHSNIPEGGTVLLSKLSGGGSLPADHEYLGVIKNPITEPSYADFASADNSTTYNAKYNDKDIYFGYYVQRADICVRHILYDQNGEYKEVLGEYVDAGITSDTTIKKGTDYDDDENIEYKGYIKTNSDNIPTLGIYTTKDSCAVKIKEIAKNRLYVNFLYKEKSKLPKELPAPDIDVIGKIDFTTTGIQTSSCESKIYIKEENWGEILSIPIYEELKFGIIKQPKYILGGVEVDQTVKEAASKLTESIVVVTNVTAHSNEQTYSMAVANVYKFIFPFKYSEYSIKNKKILKLNESYIYQPGSGHSNVVGDKMFEKDVYYAMYNLSTGVDIHFNEGDDPELGKNAFDYELYIDPLKEKECDDNQYVVKCDNFATSESKIRSGLDVSSIIVKIIGINEVVDTNYTIIENVDVYASFDDDNDALGAFGMFKYQNTGEEGEIITVRIENDDTALTIIAEAIKAVINIGVEIINGIATFLFGAEEPVIAEIDWSDADEQRILLGLAQNTHYWLNGNQGVDGKMTANRDLIFTMGLEGQTNQSTLSLNDGENDVIIAKNLDGKTYNLSIDSSNFEQTKFNFDWDSILSGLSVTYEQREFKLDGYVDFSETGIMTITDKGKEFYTKGFNPVKDLNEDFSIRSDADKNNFEATVANVKNGIRIFAGKIDYYSPDDDFNDNLYYSNLAKNNQKYIFEAKRNEYSKDINKNEEITYKEGGTKVTEKAVEVLNVYTPIELTVSELRQNNTGEPESQLVGSITDAGLTEQLILESGFEFDFGVKDYDGKYGSFLESQVKKYLGGFYVKFDFDIKELMVKVGEDYSTDYNTLKITVNGNQYKGGTVAANTWIYIPAENVESGETGLTIKTKAVNPVVGSVTYTVRAIAKNISNLESRSLTSPLSSFYETYQNICNDKYPYYKENMVKSDDSPVYYDEIIKTVENKAVERLYDFRVTDVKDVDWKDVFRDGTEHNRIAYYSGATKWRPGYKDPAYRTASEIGRNPSRLLPIGPYKHTNGTYVKAPKLGYRISFDVKLTGAYDENKKVIIEPEFYYISKDGTTMDKDIKLYYKNSSGNYVEIGSSQDNYDLTFVPDDGYRLLRAGTNHLSNKSVRLYDELSGYYHGIGEKTPLTRLVLNAGTMSTSEEDTMTFYGEYKLPNSTIAIKSDKSIADKDNYLSDGYIGVKFNITYYHDKSNKESKISYGVGMQKVPSTNPLEAYKGTSQWEREGYLGMKYSQNNSKNAQLKLEKGTWDIGEATSDNYQQILGTVVLFDLDNRAATDFN